MARGRLAAQVYRHREEERIVVAARRVIGAARHPPTTHDIATVLRAQGYAPRNLSATLLKARGIAPVNWNGHDRRGRYRWTLTPESST